MKNFLLRNKIILCIAYTQENDTIEHNYTINIYTRSITNSLIRIYLGANGKVANEVAARLNAIIANK